MSENDHTRKAKALLNQAMTHYRRDGGTNEQLRTAILGNIAVSLAELTRESPNEDKGFIATFARAWNAAANANRPPSETVDTIRGPITYEKR